MEHVNKMETMPMPKLVASMSLPLMISLLVQSLYNIVDSIFVARISEDALTATSLGFPMQLFMIAVGVGTGVGVNAALSKNIGAKDTGMVENVATTGLLLSLLGTALRQLIIFIPLAWLFASFFGISYVWYSMWISEVSAMIYAIFAAGKVMKQKEILK